MSRLCTVSILTAVVASVGLAAAASADQPTFVYQTTVTGYYLASGRDMAVDAGGNAYVVARTIGGGNDILVVKLDPEGDVLWETPINGSSHDVAGDIELDDANDVYIAGWTDSRGDFPVVGGLDPMVTKFRDAFVMKLSGADGSIIFSTLFGGDYTDQGEALALTDAGEIIIVGSTGSTDFPTTPDAYQDHPSAPLYVYTDVFIMKLTAAADSILYSTYFGGFEDDQAKYVELDPAGNIVISGTTTDDAFPLVNPIISDPQEIFVSKLSADGSTLMFSTYIGGEDIDALDGMDMDSNGYVYITGSTRSVDFPTTPGSFQDEFVGEYLGCYVSFPAHYYNCDDVFVTKMATDGSGLVYGTFVAGTKVENSGNIFVDDLGRAYIIGYTGSQDFPPDGGPPEGYGADIFVSGLSSDGSDLLFTQLVESGSSNQGHGVAVGSCGDVYFTAAVNVPADVYVARLTGIGPSPQAGVGETGTLTHLEVGLSTPNPSDGIASLTYSIPAYASAPVRLTVHDATGRLVRTLVDRMESPGAHSVSWDGADERGRPVASGVYFYHLRWNGRSETRRAVLLR
jgi:hypothetical protein